MSERLPLLEQYQVLYESDPRVQKVLELTFRDIFDFHREALKYFRKPGKDQQSSRILHDLNALQDGS